MTTAEPSTQALVWHCLTCNRQIGLVINGRLYVAGWQIITGTIECRSCGHTRSWSKKPRTTSNKGDTGHGQDEV